MDATPIIATLLRDHVVEMPVENFLVRSKRQLVEKYTDAAAWQQLGIAEQGELIREIAGLPSAISDTD